MVERANKKYCHYEAPKGMRQSQPTASPMETSGGNGGTMWASSPTKSDFVEPMLDPNAFPRGKVAERSEVG